MNRTRHPRLRTSTSLLVLRADLENTAVAVGPNGALGPTTQSIPVHWSASVTLAVIVLAVLLAVVGGLLAGGLGSWRISQLRPADALARVD